MEQWEEFFHKHSGDELCILVLESCRILLRRGEMTAEAVHHIPVRNPSVRSKKAWACREECVCSRLHKTKPRT
jgi:hypothetical protein